MFFESPLTPHYEEGVNQFLDGNLQWFLVCHKPSRWYAHKVIPDGLKDIITNKYGLWRSSKIQNKNFRIYNKQKLQLLLRKKRQWLFEDTKNSNLYILSTLEIKEGLKEKNWRWTFNHVILFFLSLLKSKFSFSFSVGKSVYLEITLATSKQIF